jgi:Ribbon-helix-helix protein, copG family
MQSSALRPCRTPTCDQLGSTEGADRKVGEIYQSPVSEPRLDGLLASSSAGIPRHCMERQFIFRADEDLGRELDEACAREERTYSSLIRFAIRKHLAENRRARPSQPDPSRAVRSSPLGGQA